MKNAVKIGTIAVAILLVLSGAALATVSPPDPGLTEFTPYAITNTDNSEVTLAYVWARVIASPEDPITINDVTTPLLRYEYYVQNLLITTIRQITIFNLDEPFFAGVDNSSAIGTATFGGGIIGDDPFVEGVDYVTFNLTLDPVAGLMYLAPGQLSKLFYIDMPWDPGLPATNNIESVDGGIEGEGQVLIGLANSSGGSGTIDPIPEPGTLLLLGSGLLGAGLGLRRKKKA